MTNDNNELLELIEKTLDDNKADDIVVIDLKGKTSIANFMVSASGTSNRHVASLADKLKYELKQKQYLQKELGEFGFTFRDDGSIEGYGTKIKELKQNLCVTH